jgi:hypothetical protein
MSLARRHRDKILAGLSVAIAPANGAGTVAPAVVNAAAGEPTPRNGPAEIAAKQVAMRLAHDLRDLKLIKSIDHKIERKRQQIGEYTPWIDGLIEADEGIGTGPVSEVAPTMMAWHIDIGNFDQALRIGGFLIRHNAPMPARFKRDAASVLVEEIATIAIKAQSTGDEFPIDVLMNLETLIDGVDMHDEIRAKLNKAIGSEMLRAGEALPADDALPVLTSAQTYLAEAHRLFDRIGVKDRIKRVAKLITVTTAAVEAAELGEAATVEGDGTGDNETTETGTASETETQA